MHPHHSEDYKLTAVKYYLSKNEDMRDVCKIFKCSYKSLSRWVNQYQEKGNVKRKTRKNSNIKITAEIEKFVKQQIRKYPTMTLWELSKLVNHTYNVKLTDKSIYNILSKLSMVVSLHSTVDIIIFLGIITVSVCIKTLKLPSVKLVHLHHHQTL